MFSSVGHSSESKSQTPSQTKVENSNTVKTPEETGNLGKVSAKAGGGGRMVSEEGRAVGGTNVPLSLQIPAKTRSAPTACTPPPPPPPPATPRKNKAAMCKPLMQNRGVSCKVEMKSKGSQTGEPGQRDTTSCARQSWASSPGPCPGYSHPGITEWQLSL